LTSRTRTIYRDNVNRVKTKKRVGFVDKICKAYLLFLAIFTIPIMKPLAIQTRRSFDMKTIICILVIILLIALIRTVRKFRKKL
jgi:hypothetical protein